MDLKDILSNIQRSIDDLQGKLNLLRSVETGTLYDVDVLMTRKEILFRENITLWNEHHTLIGAATTDLDEYAQTYKYQKALKESRAFDLERANESLRQKIAKAKAEQERASKIEAFYQTPEDIRLMAELDAQELTAIVEFKETDEAMRSELQDYIYRSKLGQLPESACIEEYNERAQTASVRLEYISDLIEPAIVEINLKRNKVRLIFTRCEDAANLMTSTQDSTTMSRLFKIITKEVGRDKPIETEFTGDVDRSYLIKFFGLREPDVEWFRIEEVQKD